MDVDVDIIEFYRPDGNTCNLFVTNIPEVSEDELHDFLYARFSTFGLLYEVQVKSGTSKHPREGLPFLYAFVKFFSQHAAALAKREATGRLLIKGRPLKVQYARRARTEAPQPLYMARCYELANHYLGFNGWSLEVKKLQEDSSSGGCVSVTAWVRLHLICSGLQTNGLARTQQSWQETDPCSRSVAICKAKKQAYQHAVEDAFSKVLLVVLETGKVHVEVNTTLEEAPQPEVTEDFEVVKVYDLDESPDESSDDEDLLNLAALAAESEEAGKNDGK